MNHFIKPIRSPHLLGWALFSLTASITATNGSFLKVTLWAADSNMWLWGQERKTRWFQAEIELCRHTWGPLWGLPEISGGQAWEERSWSCSQSGDNSKHCDLGIQVNAPFFILTDGSHLGVFIRLTLNPSATAAHPHKLITVTKKATGPKGCHSWWQPMIPNVDLIPILTAVPPTPRNIILIS